MPPLINLSVVVILACMADPCDRLQAISKKVVDDATIDSGLSEAAFLAHSGECPDSPEWKTILEQCVKSLEQRLKGRTGNAAHVIGSIGHKFPEMMAVYEQSLLESLKSANGTDRCEVILAIGKLPAQSTIAVDQLRSELADGSPLGRFYSIHAAISIARISRQPGDREEMVRWLRSCLRDPLKHVRWMAADGLGVLAPTDMETIEDLRELVADNSPSVRIASRRAIWRLTKDNAGYSILLANALREKEDSYFTQPVDFSGFHGSSYLLAMSAAAERGAADVAIVDAVAVHIGSPRKELQIYALKSLLKMIHRDIASDASKNRIKVATENSDPEVRSPAVLLWNEITRDSE